LKLKNKRLKLFKSTKEQLVNRILYQEDIDNSYPTTVNPNLWTAIVPAAGKGTRLGYHKPKILFPVAGKTIMEWLLELLTPFCSKIVFVVSANDKKEIALYLDGVQAERKELRVKYDVVVQKEPKGMADAVLAAKNYVDTRHAMVIWGDQVALRKETVLSSMRAHEHRENALLTCPTLLIDNPYIHFDRDEDGKIKRVLQKREGDEMPDVGENDSGIFLFSANTLFEKLELAKKTYSPHGNITKEFNLLPILPFFDTMLGNLVCLRIVLEEESIGINTPEQAQLLSEVLSRRS
jgi:bifunctional UDP-N-acetylglucosamine pyrophosphorylase / glucosamine-1-phosphate N-acetyltransferase